MTRRDLMIGVAGAAVTAAAGAAGEARLSERPNILFLVSEDNGPELGCYGDPSARTPRLDALASEGVRFENAFVTFSVCSPSRASFLTGLYPHQHGHLGLATHKYELWGEMPTLPGLLKAAGYRTGNVGKLHVNPASAFPYDFWPFKGANFNRRKMSEYSDAAGRFFRASEQPFYLQVNFPDAHFPLLRQQFGLPEKPHEPDEVKPLPWVGIDTPRLREFTANYYNCLARLDAGVGMVLDELQHSGRADNTLVIYIGDHGAQFSRGKTSVYEAGLRIPFLMRWPGRLKAGTVLPELVSEVDILPTVCKAAAIAEPSRLPGRSLLALARGEREPTWRQTIVGFTAGGAPPIYYPQWSIRDRRYKLIHSPLRDRPNTNAVCYLNHFNAFYKAGVTRADLEDAEPSVQRVYATYERPPLYELYDLETDPYEFTNLADDPIHASMKSRLIKALEGWQERTQDPLRTPAALHEFTAEHDRLLKRNYRKDKTFRWQYLSYLRRPGD